MSMVVKDTWSDGTTPIYLFIDGDNVIVRSPENTGPSRIKYINLTAAEHGVSSDRTVRVFQRGNDIEWLPAQCEDIDGNIYDAIRIGSQIWTAQNLRVTRFKDGTPIQLETTAVSDTVPMRYYPSNNASYVESGGYLYNWAAATSGLSIAPNGWHVPTKQECDDLNTFLRSNPAFYNSQTDVYTCKSLSSRDGWTYSSTDCAVGYYPELNDATGFNGYPVGYKPPNGRISGSRGSHVGYHTTTVDSSDSTKSRVLLFYYQKRATSTEAYVKTYGWSIRLIKNAE